MYVGETVRMNEKTININLTLIERESSWRSLYSNYLPTYNCSWLKYWPPFTNRQPVRCYACCNHFLLTDSRNQMSSIMPSWNERITRIPPKYGKVYQHTTLVTETPHLHRRWAWRCLTLGSIHRRPRNIATIRRWLSHCIYHQQDLLLSLRVPVPRLPPSQSSSPSPSHFLSLSRSSSLFHSPLPFLFLFFSPSPSVSPCPLFISRLFLLFLFLFLFLVLLLLNLSLCLFVRNSVYDRVFEM